MQTKNPKVIINNLKMKNFIIIRQPISILPFLKSFVLDIKNIYIRILYSQYIKKSLYLKFIFIFLTKLKVNVNNALNIFKMLNLFLNDKLCFIYYIKSNN